MRGVFILIFLLFSTLISAQVQVRLFSNKSPESVVFSVVSGNYKIESFNGNQSILNTGDLILISKFNGKLAVKMRNKSGFICDSLLFSANTDTDTFSIRINGPYVVKQYYSGDLRCIPDLGTILMINICDIERYIAGVVKAEGGSGKKIEYFKSQAVIARTYMFKYMNKHLQDGYNLCDNTHCQVFNGLSSDTILNRAALLTKDQVILDKDSVLIISAFHSNCGGETSASDDVWLSGQPYFKKVTDPYCINSRNAFWEKRISYNTWVEYVKKYGFTGATGDPSVFSFYQKSRLADYSAGSFKIPLRTMRSDLNLNSTFFSVVPVGEEIVFKGRGYGHGVGFCQEGAMAMAAKGFSYSQIIDFYYSEVFISDIKNAVILPADQKNGGR